MEGFYIPLVFIILGVILMCFEKKKQDNTYQALIARLQCPLHTKGRILIEHEEVFWKVLKDTKRLGMIYQEPGDYPTHYSYMISK